LFVIIFDFFVFYLNSYNFNIALLKYICCNTNRLVNIEICTICSRRYQF